MHTLKQLAEFIDAKIVGDAKLEIHSIAPLDLAKNNQLSYVVSKKYSKALTTSKAGAVILSEDLLTDCPTNALVVDNPHLAFAKITHYFKHKATHTDGIHPSAKTNNAKIAQNCVIGENVVLGKDCTIGAFTVVEDGVITGNNVHLASNVVIMQDCTLGDNVFISPGVVIGSEGFGNARDAQCHWHSIAHLGKVTIGNDVTIGANTAIDRGTLGDTEIHNGARIDNLVHIAHNVIIGQDCAIAASTGIAGGAVLGKRCMVGGIVGIAGHISICDDVTINAKSSVYTSIKKPGVYTGIVPLMSHKHWQNTAMWLTKLDKITNYLNIKLKNLKD